jgi:transposase
MLKNHYVTKLINLKGVKFKDIDIQEDTVHILVNSLHDFQLCKKCLEPTSKLVDVTPKVYRDLDLIGRRCYIEVDLRRFECRNCLCTFTEPLSFAAPYRHFTNRFENEIYECCRETTAVYAASKFGISDKTAAEIYQTIAKRKQELNSFLATEVIGIDEIAMHKGHKDFVVVISDLTNKRVIDVLRDRKKEALEAYMDTWSLEFKSKIKSVAIDLWGPYRSVVESKLPNAKAVADRFHVMQNLNKALDNCRKKAKRDSENENIWKQAKYAILKNGENLSSEQRDILNRVLTASPPLKKCYELKESFRNIFNSAENRIEGSQKLAAWILDVVRTNTLEYYAFARTLLNWEENILNYFDDWVSSGFVEGINNKIKLIKRKAFGFVNFENFRIKIIDCFS